MDYQFLHDTMSSVFRLVRMHRCECEKEIGRFGIHHSQHRMLMYLARCGDNAPTQVQIAKHFDISAAAVAVTVRKLEAGGYIRRAQYADDMRNNNVYITQKGLDVTDKSADIFRAVDKKIFSGLTDDEIKTLGEYIEIMCSNLSEGDSK